MSEVARLRKQIEAEYQAARLGLTGTAIVGGHEFITKRTENIEKLYTGLAALVGETQAIEAIISISDKVGGE